MFRRFLVRRYWKRFLTRGGVRTWAAETIARHAVNRRVSGSPGTWPVEWLAGWLKERSFSLPLERALSIGCGAGALERDLMSKGLCADVVGLDISPEAIEQARRSAAEEGWSAITYRVADLDDLSLPPVRYGAVFAHQALHHVDNLEHCLDEISRSLERNGIVYLDEYVGPSRSDWNREMLAVAEEIFQTLPRRARRRRRLELPVDWRDPSEAVRSSAIVPLVEERFEILERRDYGGNLLAVIHPHLALERLRQEEVEEILERLLQREESLLATGVPSFYTVIVAGVRSR